ncbi:NlpC/P60 family protein [Nocardioides sp. GXQ0305]|uniref:C40 family peptidase n=1 Tax=Nocardioides sp. GXQ0305 TaxID=3423912 RepID=UPI003D7D4169
MLNGRKPLVSALTGLALAGVIGLVPGSAHADPDIDDVEARVDRLYHDAEVAQERYHDATLELDELRNDLGSLKADQERQDQRLDVVQEQVRDSVIRQYQGESLSAVGQVFVSDEPRSFLDQLSTMTSYSELQSQLFTSYSREATALDIRRDATERRLSDIAELEKQLADEKATVDEKLAEAKDLLGELEAEEREQMTSRSAPAPAPTNVEASGNAAAAVSFALGQVGDAYVYGAAGPDAYDCSGLTMAAWAQAGVSLPHSSSAQYGSGPQVAASALQPGDLVFYYSPISHVGMYIGNGQIVHAANPSTGVQVAGLYSMPYSGAVRPG